MKNNKKIILLALSGGIDSLFLLIKNLEQGNIVYPFFVKGNYNITKSRLELRQTKAIHKVLKNKYNFSNLQDLIITRKYIFPNFYNLDVSPQNLLLIIAAFNLEADIYCHRFETVIDEVQIGNVAGDHSNGLVKIYKNIWKNLQSTKVFINGNNSSTKIWTNDYYNHISKLEFPIANINKMDIYREIYNNYTDIYNLCVSCECPSYDKNTKKYINCNECHSCITRAYYDELIKNG